MFKNKQLPAIYTRIYCRGASFSFQLGLQVLWWSDKILSKFKYNVRIASDFALTDIVFQGCSSFAVILAEWHGIIIAMDI